MISGISYYLRVVGVRGLVCAIIGKITKKLLLLKMNRPGIRFPFFLRVPSTDVPAFDQIFIKKECDFEVKRPPVTIVDAGANIGLASIYFSNKFPDAKIIAIEPEDSNLNILRKNIAPYGNITLICGALWRENSRIDLVDPGLGKWAFMTQSQDGVEKRHGEFVHQVQGMTVDTIMKEHGIDHIDIIKIDIEGAEREVFRDPSLWLEKVDALIVELHEHMKPGCNRSFRNVSKAFTDKWLQGEKVYLTRSGGCLTRRCT